jgi:hypothetical protein
MGIMMVVTLGGYGKIKLYASTMLSSMPAMCKSSINDKDGGVMVFHRTWVTGNQQETGGLVR